MHCRLVYLTEIKHADDVRNKQHQLLFEQRADIYPKYLLREHA